MNLQPALWVVLPVHNEATAIRGVVEEWIPALRKTGSTFAIMAINDGSTDDTGSILESLPQPELRVWHRWNAGHGPTCRFGYQTAVAQGAEWVLQIDSDGQCDPAFFSQLWEARQRGPAVFGCRVKRDDGASRWWISRMVSLVVLLHAGCWIKDANVPYRLMRADHLCRALEPLPENAFFANILLSCLLAREILWIPIGFRRRTGGSSMLKPGALFRFAGRLSRELRELKKRRGHGKENSLAV